MKNDETILNIYLKQINKIPLLTHEEEVELATKAKAGDKVAKEKIINANLRFVVNIAKQYQNRGMELEDLISEGNMGLMSAIDHFDVSKGFHFISYAVWWIRQSILKALNEKTRAIRIPLNKVNDMVKIEHARKIVDSALQDEATEELEIAEIGKMLGMDSRYVKEMLTLNHEMVSLDAQIGDDSNGKSFGETLEDKKNVVPEDYAMEVMLKSDLDYCFSHVLRPNEAKVLRLRYGLDDGKTMSLKEIGEECNLTKERIRQIEKKALFRMQTSNRCQCLEDYLTA